jgi:hypothetical protein
VSSNSRRSSSDPARSFSAARDTSKARFPSRFRDRSESTMPPQIDVLGLGSAAVDETLYVETYPSPDTKTRVLRRELRCGGLTATALVAATRLGARCAYAGRLGLDYESRLVEEYLARERVDLLKLPGLRKTALSAPRSSWRWIPVRGTSSPGHRGSLGRMKARRRRL